VKLAAQEVTIGWHDRMYLRPGDGVKLNRQQEPTFPGLVLMGAGTTNGNIGDQESSAAFAQHTYDLLNSLSANASVSLNFTVFSGDADFSFFRRQTFSADDLNFVVTYTKNFGTIRFTPSGMSPDFSAVMGALRQKSLRQADLYSAATATFGTHFVAGYSSGTFVSVLYSIHSASAVVKQSATLTANASWTSGDFSAFVSGKVLITNTASFINYQIYSSDPSPFPTNLGFAATGTITNLAQFSLFTSNVQNYASTLTQTNDKITGYILDPLWFVPGVLPLLDGYVPPAVTQPNYDRFLHDYDALESYKQSLDPWILDGNALSWLNDPGRQLVRGNWLSAVNYLAAMKKTAMDHFAKGTPLTVPADAAAFLANLSDISLPAIYIMDSFVSGDRYILGRVDCGCRNLTIPVPFHTISQLYYGTNRAVNTGQDALATVYYDPADFQSAQLVAYPSGNSTSVYGHLTNLFSGLHWNCFTNPGSNPDLNGFFLVHESTSEAPHYTLAISSGADANGNPVVVDQMSFLDTLSGDCPGSCLITLTNLVNGTP
jgi:hypothetical protein